MDRGLLTALTDCHMSAFSLLWDLEKARKTKAKSRLAAVLVSVDVLAGETVREDYAPQDDDRSW